MTKCNVFLLLVSLFFLSCSKEEKTFEYTKVLTEIEYLNQQQSQNSNENSFAQFQLNNANKSVGKKVLNLGEKLCSHIFSNDFANPFNFEKIFSKEVKYQKFLKYIATINGLNKSCLSSEFVIDHYPITIIKFNLEEETTLYGFFRVDEDSKISTFYFLPILNTEVKHQLVEMTDKVRISTFSFTTKGAKETIFIKSPYVHTTSFGYYINLAHSFLKMKKNVVIQSNRGSHASTGNFKWLHESNISDSRDTINWITKQEFSDGKVTTFGVSYDGYNSLAAAASNAEGLVSSIACSAPSNAATDSFTAGKSVEKYLLNYIAQRENQNDILLFSEKFDYLLKNNIPFEEIDNHLYGRDIADWTDLTVARNEGSLKSYFKERSILNELKESTVPIFHVAGTNQDQDSRDTVLAFNYLKREARFPEKNYLYIHHNGHGCGPFLEKKFASDFMEGRYNSLREEYRDFSERSQSSANVKMDFNEIELELYSSSVPSIINNRHDIDDLKSNQFFVQVEEDLIINGELEIELETKSSLSKSSVIVSLFRSENDEWEVPHSMVWGTSRTSFYFEDSSEGRYKLTLPPMHFKISAGEYLLIDLSTSSDSYVDLFKAERTNYYEVNADAGFFEIIDSKIRIKMDIENKKDVKESY